jgi:hypothetical protein
MERNSDFDADVFFEMARFVDTWSDFVSLKLGEKSAFTSRMAWSSRKERSPSLAAGMLIQPYMVHSLLLLGSCRRWRLSKPWGV